MKTFIACLLVAAAGLFIYTHPDVWRKYSPFTDKTPPPPAFAQKESFALKMISRLGDKPYQIKVILIDGNRWRTETKSQGSSKIYVAVCDGTKTVAVPPMGSTAMMDPRAGLNQMLAGAAGISDVSEDKAQVDTEQRDGHTCWKTSAVIGGLDAQVWVDAISSFPVGFDVSLKGLHMETHISQLQGDLLQDAAEFFDTAHTEPLLTSELEDDVNKRLIDHFSQDTPKPKESASILAPGPALQMHYVLKQPVTVTTAYGTVTIPANTEVRILGQTANDYHVSGGGAEFDVPGDQVSTVQQ